MCYAHICSVTNRYSVCINTLSVLPTAATEYRVQPAARGSGACRKTVVWPTTDVSSSVPAASGSSKNLEAHQKPIVGSLSHLPQEIITSIIEHRLRATQPIRLSLRLTCLLTSPHRAHLPLRFFYHPSHPLPPNRLLQYTLPLPHRPLRSTPPFGR